jgi:predicted PurR-regulated permease PerM
VLAALLLHPLVAGLRRLRVPRAAAALIVVGCALAGVGVLIDATIEPAQQWIERAPQVLHDVDVHLRPLRRWLHKVETVTHQAERVTSGTGKTAVVAAVPDATQGVLLITRTVVVNAVSVIVLTFFLLATRPVSLARAAGALRGPWAARRALIVIGALRVELGRYYGTVALINAALGLATAGLAALFGLPNPALWGAVAAVLNFVPYFGPATTLCLLTVVALGTPGGLGSATGLAGSFLLLTMVEGQVVQPIAVGHRLAVSPLVVIIALMFWGWLWGGAGLVLAVPLVLAVKAVCTHVPRWRAVASAMGPRAARTRVPRR